jgi:glycosyltransferase involved in cell wall biosynthesis
MKVASIIENNLETGGGFTMSLSSLIDIDMYLKKNNIKHSVYVYNKDNLRILKSFNITSYLLKVNFLNKIFSYYNWSLFGLYFQNKFRIITKLEKKLISDNVDLVNFVTTTPTPFVLQKLNYIFTVMDICHRDYPEFAEVKEFNTLRRREMLLQACLAPAIIIVTESEELREKIFSKYSVDKQRIVSIPNYVSPFILNKIFSEKEINEVKNKYLLPEKFFFYPAQFWQHKNHIRIIEAVNILKKKGKDFTVIFCGSDKGNLNYIRKEIKKHNLEKNIKILGFIPINELGILYKLSFAVIMPTFFGPTNIPVVEAWYYDIPLIYSSHLKNQVDDAALLVDPLNSHDIAKKMEEICIENIRLNLIQNGKKKLEDLRKSRELGYSIFIEKLKLFDHLRKCWTNE